MDWFKEGYEFFIYNFGSAYSSFSSQAYINSITMEIDKLSRGINSFAGYQTAANKLKGDIAEFWHSGTYNIDAALNRSSNRAVVNRSHGLGSIDITVGKDGYGSKYDASAANTLREQAKTFYERYKEYVRMCERSGNEIPSFSDYIAKNANTLRENGINPENIYMHDPLYGDQIRLVPSDQIKEIEQLLKEKILKGKITSPDLVNRYENTLKMLQDKIQDSDGNKSIPLSNKEAKEIAKLAKDNKFKPSDFGLTPEELIKYKHILKQAFSSGLSAATISVVLKVAPEIVKAIQYLVQNGELDEIQFQEIGFSALTGASEGFIRGSVSAAITTICKSGIWGEAMKSVDPTVIGVITVITIDTMKNAFAVAGGKKTSQEMADELIKELFVSSCSLLLGGVVQSILTEMPVLGYMLGSFIGSVVGSFVYSAGYKTAISFCVDTGFTMFGLVDQNYTLPEKVMRQIGFDVFDYEKFELQKFEFNKFQFDKFCLDPFKPDILDITFLRRGVIGIRQIGYI